MSITSTVILILGILALVEGIFIATFPKQIIKLLKKAPLRKIAITEIIVAIILILIGINL